MTRKEGLYGFINRLIVICAATLTLAACGGGGGGQESLGPTPSNPTITGLAATGGALANATVTAKCTSGAPVAGNTDANGNFSLELAGGQTLPCLLEVVSGTVKLHSFAVAAGHTNITPLTELVVSKALGSDPAAAFATFDASKGAAIANGLAAAKTFVVAQVTPVAGDPSVDMVTGVFNVAVTDPYDKALVNLQTALTAAGKTLADMDLAAASGGSIQAVVTRQTWFFSDGAALTASQVTSFDAQGLYFNVHSAAHPGGEIRGQIAPATTSFVTDGGAPATSNTFSALMSGAQEVPVNASTASAYSTFVLDPVANTISGVLVTNGIAGTAAHIHKGAPGVSGPVIFPLTGGPTIWTLAPTPISAAQITDLTTGQNYVNVHSTALPGGELRGQLTQQLRFGALSGANEVPPVTSTASATGVLALDPTTNLVSGFVKTSGIAGTVAHVHEAAAGVNGSVIVPLTETPAGSGLWVVSASQAPLTATQVASFNAGNLYFNVHSAAHPGGEIRSQIVPATVKLGTATLSGANEVPAVTTDATGTGIMALNSITQLVNGNVKTAGIVGTIAHVHEAAAGVAGSVIVPLTLKPPLSSIQSPLAVSTTSLADGSVGTAYSQSLTATGGTTPYTWTVSVGTLPAGLNISAAGVISGTPTAAGTASFTVMATDSATPAAASSKALSINVTAAPAATVSFATQIQPIFNANCVTACHSPGGISSFMNLTAGNSFAALVQSVPPRVIAGSSATSLLYQRVTGAALPQMPLGGTPLSAADQTLIKNWIDQGAANN
jgi:hypothetical protein